MTKKEEKEEKEEEVEDEVKEENHKPGKNKISV